MQIENNSKVVNSNPYLNISLSTLNAKPVLNCNMVRSKHSSSFQNVFHKKSNYMLLTGEGNGTPLQNSCLENPMDGGAWQAADHGVAKCRTRLSDFTFTFPFHALEKEIATHSSILAQRIPGTGEPGGLPSMGSHRVRHN